MVNAKKFLVAKAINFLAVVIVVDAAGVVVVLLPVLRDLMAGVVMNICLVDGYVISIATCC